jgi:hypothetical protein
LRSALKSAGVGAVVAAVLALFSAALGLLGFGRAYYVAVFLPFFLVVCLLIAWFLYLKDDGFIRKPEAAAEPGAPIGPAGSGGDGSSVEVAGLQAEGAAGRLDPSLLADLRSGLIERRLAERRPGERRPAAPAAGRGRAIASLLWAALWLGLLASALYAFGGVGAGYFIPVGR